MMHLGINRPYKNIGSHSSIEWIFSFKKHPLYLVFATLAGFLLSYYRKKPPQTRNFFRKNEITLLSIQLISNSANVCSYENATQQNTYKTFWARWRKYQKELLYLLVCSIWHFSKYFKTSFKIYHDLSWTLIKCLECLKNNFYVLSY